AAVTVSRNAAERFQKPVSEGGYGLKDMGYLYPVIDLSFYNPDNVAEQDIDRIREQYAISKEKKVVLMAGRPIEEKGYDVVIDAVAGLPPEIQKNVVIAIAGRALADPDDPYAKMIREKIEMLRGNGAHVLLLGGLTAKEMRDWYCLSDLVAMPSRRHKDVLAEETFGLVSVEAQCMGKPVVVSDSGGLPETLADDQSGFVVREDDVEGFRETIGELLTHPDLAARVGAHAKQTVNRRFSVAANLIDHLKLYLSVMRIHAAKAREITREGAVVEKAA
ncbi:MAG: glycosyltransferase family 4 protein, partial [Candidatus Omnitrophica bacterium]|nr:glycosyltransferase family 4 protein [Candidatus Omnitrophota bacterium]